MRFILVFMLLISTSGYGQLKNYIISVKGDTLNRVDIKDRKQGPWVIHVDELRGEPGYDEQGYFADNKKEGAWVQFSLMGDKIAEENYRWGNRNGKCRYYTRARAGWKVRCSDSAEHVPDGPSCRGVACLRAPTSRTWAEFFRTTTRRMPLLLLPLLAISWPMPKCDFDFPGRSARMYTDVGDEAHLRGHIPPIRLATD